MVQRNFHTGLKVLAASLLCIGFASLGTAAELKSGVEKQYFDPSVRIQDNIFLARTGHGLRTHRFQRTKVVLVHSTFCVTPAKPARE